MKNTRLSFLLAFVTFALIFSVLTVLFWPFMSDTILVPIYYFLWVCRMIINSVPEGVYLALLVIISLSLSLRTFERARSNRHHRRVIRSQPNSDSRYLHWRNLCIHSYGNWFSKGQLSFEIRTLILSILAFEQGVEISEAEAMVRNGTLTLSDTLRNVVEMKNTPETRPNRFSGLLFWRHRQPVQRIDTSSDVYVDQLLAELISFAEHHLEITTHAGHKS
jgi:hypothetical protein